MVEALDPPGIGLMLSFFSFLGPLLGWQSALGMGSPELQVVTLRSRRGTPAPSQSTDPHVAVSTGQEALLPPPAFSSLGNALCVLSLSILCWVSDANLFRFRV